MLTDNQLEEIEENLKNGEEVDIICNNQFRQVALFNQTYDFSG